MKQNIYTYPFNDANDLPLPSSPLFSSGPCRKPSHKIAIYPNNEFLGRFPHSTKIQQRIQYLCSLQKEILNIPEDYKLLVIGGSTSAAMDCAFWNLLGDNHVDVFCSDHFANEWNYSINQQLNIHTNTFDCFHPPFVDFSKANPDNDWVIVYNGTTSGVCMRNCPIPARNNNALTIADACSAAFCMNIPFKQLDVVVWSWQKALGGEGGIGMIALSPKALDKLYNFPTNTQRPFPRIFRLKNKNGSVNEGLFNGKTTNTISMMLVEDAINSLLYFQKNNSLTNAIKHTQTNLTIVTDWLNQYPQEFQFSVSDPAFRSPSSITINVLDENNTVSPQLTNHISQYLSQHNVSYDIKGHSMANPLNLRIWAGPTIPHDDVHALLPHIHHARLQILSQL